MTTTPSIVPGGNRSGPGPVGPWAGGAEGTCDEAPPTGEVDGAVTRGGAGQVAVLIIPAPTVTPVASSIRMNEPVVRFLE